MILIALKTTGSLEMEEIIYLLTANIASITKNVLHHLIYRRKFTLFHSSPSIIIALMDMLNTFVCVCVWQTHSPSSESGNAVDIRIMVCVIKGLIIHCRGR